MENKALVWDVIDADGARVGNWYPSIHEARAAAAKLGPEFYVDSRYVGVSKL